MENQCRAAMQTQKPERPSFRSLSRRFSCIRIKDQGPFEGTAIGAEVKQILDRPGDRVKGLITDPAKLPVIFDEAQDRRLIGYRVSYKILLGEGRNCQEREPWTIAAAVKIAPVFAVPQSPVVPRSASLLASLDVLTIGAST